MIVWGINHEEGPISIPMMFWVIIIIGFGAVSLLCYAQLRRNLNLERHRRERTVHLLRSSDTASPNYVAVLREAFVAFDTEYAPDATLPLPALR